MLCGDVELVFDIWTCAQASSEKSEVKASRDYYSGSRKIVSDKLRECVIEGRISLDSYCNIIDMI